MSSSEANLKREAAAEALRYVRDGMVVGLGTGSTAAHFIELLGEALQQGELRDITGIPTSNHTAESARALGIPLASLASAPHLDLAVDGADEVDPDLNLIKGLGKALLREKITEIHTDNLVIIVDDSKLVSRLGTRDALPVEVVPFAHEVTIAWLNTLGCTAALWLDDQGAPVITDNHNYLAKCWFRDGISDPYELARFLQERPGVVEHGLFLDMAKVVVVAAATGIEIVTKPLTELPAER